MATRGPTDYADTPYARQARERKATELEQIVVAAGGDSDSLLDRAVRDDAVAVLSGQRGKRTGASTRTWSVVWQFMHGNAVTRGAIDVNPFEKQTEPAGSR